MRCTSWLVARSSLNAFVGIGCLRRAPQGQPWEQIGAALGITRQAAREFFTRDAREALAGNTDGDEQLGEDDALDLAVEEVRGVRRGRPLVEG